MHLVSMLDENPRRNLVNRDARVPDYVIDSAAGTGEINRLPECRLP